MVKASHPKTYILLLSAVFFTRIFAGVASAQESYPVIFEAIHRAVLSAERHGVLKYLKYDVGDNINKGNTIAEVDISDLNLEKKRATIRFRFLNEKLKDLQKLSERGLATNEDLGNARMEKDIAWTDIEILKKQISNSRIYAPYNCVVVKRLTQPHEWVTEGQPVIEIVNPRKLRAVGNIPSQLAVALKKGDSHSFYVHDIDAVVTGKVDALSPIVDERSNTEQVIWVIDKTTELDLLPGMKGEVRFGQ